MCNTTFIWSLNLQVFLKSPMKPTEFPKECIPVKSASPSLQQHRCSPASLCIAKPGDKERSGHRNLRLPGPGSIPDLDSIAVSGLLLYPGSLQVLFSVCPITSSCCLSLPQPRLNLENWGFSVISVQHFEAASPGSCLLSLLLPSAEFSFSHLLF